MKEMRIMRAIGDIDDAYIDEAAPSEKKRALRLSSWTGYAGIAAAAVLAVGIGVFVMTRGAGVGTADPAQTEPTASVTETTAATEEPPDLAQAANPFEDYATLEEAVKASGIQMSVPDSIAGLSEKSVSVIFGDLIQVTYTDAAGESAFTVRKAKGTDDPSGDYNDYAEIKELTAGGRTVTLKGNGGTVSLAVWNDGSFAYSVSSDKTGITQAEMEDIIKNVK